jgi:hypothetical protein
MIVVLIAIAFACEGWRTSVTETLFSPFWLSTIAWLIAYPLRAVLLNDDLVDLQVANTFSEMDLLIALWVSFLFWSAMYIGFVAWKCPGPGDNRLEPSGWYQYRAALFLLAALGAATVFILVFLYQGGQVTSFVATAAIEGTQVERRVGHGPEFFFAEFYFYAALIFVASILGARRRNAWHFALIGVVLAASIVVGTALNTRRLVAGTMICLALLLLSRRRLSWWGVIPLLALGILAVPLLQVYRYIPLETYIEKPDAVAEAVTLFVQDSRLPLTTLSSSYEGVEHVALFLRKADDVQLFAGVDWGLSWIYNAILSVIPRTIWTSKPEIYGSISIQYFLFPQLFTDGPAVSTFPSGFIVDFSYGFGLIFGAMLSGVTGRMLGILQFHLHHGSNVFLRSIGLFFLIFSFNLVRSGTAILQSVLVLLVACVLALGIAPIASGLRLFWEQFRGVSVLRLRSPGY